MLQMITTEVPVGLETYYEPLDDGKFRLKVEGAVASSEIETLKNKNKEFRESNINLLKEAEKYKSFSTLIGDDKLSPDKFQEKIETLASSRVAALTEQMKQSYETKLKETTEFATRTSSRLNDLVLGSEVTKAAADHGVISTALEDVIVRAKASFDIVDGEIKFKESKLDPQGSPYTVSSWLKEVKVKAPHLFAPSQGTGAMKPVKNNVGRAVQKSTLDKLASGISQLQSAAPKRLT
jgi:hypothetical protein